MKYVRLSILTGITVCCGYLIYAYVFQGEYSYHSGIQTYFEAVTQKNEKPPDTVLVFGGDVMLSRTIETIADWKGSPLLFWHDVHDILYDADVSFINLESPISDKGIEVGNLYSFRADPAMLAGIAYAGIDVVSFANNHVWDWGRDAFVDTIARLREQGIAPLGAGLTYTEAHTPYIVDTPQLSIAYLAYTNLLPASLLSENAEPAVAGIHIPTIQKDIIHAKDMGADIVVASFHWGDEYQTTHNAEQERIAKAVIDMGADIVVGHHPHVPQEIEIYNGGVIAYSLGNFVFDQNFSKATSHGLLMRVNIDREGDITRVEKIDLTFDSTYVPKPGTIEYVL